jgi:hypothetical protein
MTFSDLQVPPFRRRKMIRPGVFVKGGASAFPKAGDKPSVPTVPTLEFTGPKVAEFVTDILSNNPHFTAEQVQELATAQKITGVQFPDKALGKLIGVMHGRYWYVA